MNNQRISSLQEDIRAPLLLGELREEHINHWHDELEEEYKHVQHKLQHGLNEPCKIVTIAVYTFIDL
ncbi:hypothetical protein [Halobacillus sp. B23F22_1]|uniref:hypothetical protein n=1 Tax=Halobacillus sp. B23F22_1 TaxID=3459514 RepID=UPI00373EAFF4